MDPTWTCFWLILAAVAFALAALIVARASDNLLRAPLLWVALGLLFMTLPPIITAARAA